jgi:hypothetical protein
MNSRLGRIVQYWRMRLGITTTIMSADRRRLEALVRDRNTVQKHVRRAHIVLLGADDIGTNEIMHRTGKSKTCVWRWQGQENIFRAALGALEDVRDVAGLIALTLSDRAGAAG